MFTFIASPIWVSFIAMKALVISLACLNFNLVTIIAGFTNDSEVFFEATESTYARMAKQVIAGLTNSKSIAPCVAF